MLKNVAQVLGAANGAKATDPETLIKRAAALISAATVLIEGLETAVGPEKLDEIKEGVGKGLKKAGRGIGSAIGSVGDILAKAGGKKDELAEYLENARSEKDLKRVIREARQATLEKATSKTTVKDFVKSRVSDSSDPGKAVAVVDGYKMPGCFVIATYKKLDRDKDLTDYLGVYVGKAEKLSDGISEAVSSAGNPDVYADVKYGQNVHVYIYNSLPESLDDQYGMLMQIFCNDERSYNHS